MHIIRCIVVFGCLTHIITPHRACALSHVLLAKPLIIQHVFLSDHFYVGSFHLLELLIVHTRTVVLIYAPTTASTCPC